MASQNYYPPYVYSSQSTSTNLNSYTGSYYIDPNLGAGVNNVSITSGGHSYSSPSPIYSTSITTTHPDLTVSGDANFDGDVKIKGRSMVAIIEGIEKRLAVLQPDPAKLAKWEALQKAYAHYKLLEALLHEDDNGNA